MARYDYSYPNSTPAPSYRSQTPPPAYTYDPPPPRSWGRPPPLEYTPLIRKEPEPGRPHIIISGFRTFYACIRDSSILLFSCIADCFKLLLVFIGEFFLQLLVFALIVTFIFYVPSLSRFLKSLFVVPPPPVYSVAIIGMYTLKRLKRPSRKRGAGPAGICAAQHLYHRARARGVHVNITIFESAPVIGGQLALNSSTGSPVFPYDDPTQDPIIAEDIAGTALLWGNPLFTKTSEKILGDEVQISEADSQQVSYFSGDHVVAETTRPYAKTPFFDWTGLIFRYGSSVWSAGVMAKQGAELQDRLVDLPLVPDIAQLMISIGIFDYVKKSTRQELNDRGIGGAYVPEVLSPEVGRVYSQSMSDISALALMLAAGIEDTASAYVGGELIERLEMIVSAIGAHVRESTEVHGIKYARIDEDNSTWLVQHSSPSSSGRLQAEPFDKVIIAAPKFDLYRAASAEDVEAASVLAYHTAHVAFFTVPRRIDAYGGDVNQVLFLENALGGIRELAFVREIARIGDDGHSTVEYLYRALADNDALEQLEQLNLRISWSYQKKLENAYPYMLPTTRFPPFKLSDKGLWWTSAIHMIASTVDTSCHAGKIVAEQLINELRR
ncbi:hypothetical protein Daesc_004340 [Daldinia eschscholtzii]|uniref:Prenylcysteine lyase domain-containing protein n=1 Tax=Daldinia eschscholtzii TaxID=292717 RepID=A0AAX6MPK2_9PEZI